MHAHDAFHLLSVISDLLLFQDIFISEPSRSMFNFNLLSYFSMVSLPFGVLKSHRVPCLVLEVKLRLHFYFSLQKDIKVKGFVSEILKNEALIYKHIPTLTEEREHRLLGPSRKNFNLLEELIKLVLFVGFGFQKL
jgi:hypothetical protein